MSDTPVAPARDLAAEAHESANGRQVFVRHVFTRLPLVSAFVITINLFVQVRGDVGLAVAIAQNLTFGAIAVIVLLNLVIYIMVGVMVALMPMIFDSEFNRWMRIVGALVLVLFCTVLIFTASWLLLAGLLVAFVVIGIVVRLGSRKKPPADADKTTIVGMLEQPTPPVDTELRALWADGRAMLRVISPDKVPVTTTETTLQPAPEPKTLADVAAEWNARTATIRGTGSKSLTRGRVRRHHRIRGVVRNRRSHSADSVRSARTRLDRQFGADPWLRAAERRSRALRSRPVRHGAIHLGHRHHVCRVVRRHAALVVGLGDRDRGTG